MALSKERLLFLVLRIFREARKIVWQIFITMSQMFCHLSVSSAISPAFLFKRQPYGVSVRPLAAFVGMQQKTSEMLTKANHAKLSRRTPQVSKIGLFCHYFCHFWCFLTQEMKDIFSALFFSFDTNIWDLFLGSSMTNLYISIPLKSHKSEINRNLEGRFVLETYQY